MNPLQLRVFSAKPNPSRSSQNGFSRLRMNALTLGAALLLAGCASGPLRVNTQVQAFSTSSSNAFAWQGARYRFDVLPSQAGLNLQPLHAMAEATLATHGLVRDDASARYTVQIAAHVRTAWVDERWGHASAWGAPRWGWGMGFGHGYGPHGWGMAHFPPTSTHWRELRLAVLDGQTQQTVYETHARSESPSRAHNAIFAAMLQAALQDFPNHTTGWQQVVRDVPAQADSSAAAPHPPKP